MFLLSIPLNHHQGLSEILVIPLGAFYKTFWKAFIKFYSIKHEVKECLRRQACECWVTEFKHSFSSYCEAFFLFYCIFSLYCISRYFYLFHSIFTVFYSQVKDNEKYTRNLSNEQIQKWYLSQQQFFHKCKLENWQKNDVRDNSFCNHFPKARH